MTPTEMDEAVEYARNCVDGKYTMGSMSRTLDAFRALLAAVGERDANAEWHRFEVGAATVKIQAYELRAVAAEQRAEAAEAALAASEPEMRMIEGMEQDDYQPTAEDIAAAQASEAHFQAWCAERESRSPANVAKRIAAERARVVEAIAAELESASNGDPARFVAWCAAADHIRNTNWAAPEEESK